MNIVGGIDALQLLWLSLAIAVAFWAERLLAGLMAKADGPIGTAGNGLLKIIPGG